MDVLQVTVAYALAHEFWHAWADAPLAAELPEMASKSEALFELAETIRQRTLATEDVEPTDILAPQLRGEQNQYIYHLSAGHRHEWEVGESFVSYRVYRGSEITAAGGYPTGYPVFGLDWDFSQPLVKIQLHEHAAQRHIEVAQHAVKALWEFLPSASRALIMRQYGWLAPVWGEYTPDGELDCRKAVVEECEQKLAAARAELDRWSKFGRRGPRRPATEE